MDKVILRVDLEMQGGTEVSSATQNERAHAVLFFCGGYHR